MVISIATTEDIQSMKRELVEEMRGLINTGQTGSPKRWLKTEEVMRLLELSASTLQTLRRNGTLPFSRIGAIIFYDREDIDNILLERKQRKQDITSKQQSRTRK